jgi:acid phosphatase
VAGQVQAWLEKALARTAERRPAVVFSLDDVLLSNYARRKALDFAEPAVLSANLGLPPALLNPPLPALAPLLPLFAFARDHGAAVFIVSERPEIERAEVQDNLTRAGYEGWAAILLAPPGEEKQPVAGVKARLREIIESRGYAIVATVGSKEADLAGGHAEKGFLLPDPRY